MANVRDLNIRELKLLAKKRALKGYSKKNKYELIQMLQNPLDEPVPDINVPVLTPQPLSKVQRFKEYAADKRQIFKKYANYKWNSFVNWLTQHLPPKPKVYDEAFEHVKNSILKLFPRKKDTFEVVETKSALKEFAKEYMIPVETFTTLIRLWTLLKKPSLTF